MNVGNKILVIGSGGREHALVWRLSQDKSVETIFCAPGNPGIEKHAKIIPLSSADLEGLASFAVEEGITLTIVGPEVPLVAGIADLFASRGLTIFGPSGKASQLEGSKVFAKNFMKRHGIPTARYETFNLGQGKEASSFIRTLNEKLVLKADGLAAGKGVLIAESHAEARENFDRLATEKPFGNAGDAIVIEEFLEGFELSIFAVCDGKDALLLPPAQDHKRAWDGDRGKNTGGMGAYAPAPGLSMEQLDAVMRTVIQPTLDGMRMEGNPFTGLLYAGLMITPEGPKVLEYNVRFGDPETQAVLPLVGGDFHALLHSAAVGRLEKNFYQPKKGCAVTVIAASGGYPESFRKGFAIHGIERAERHDGVLVFHAGTERHEGTIRTSGGRVLAVTAFSEESLFETAIDHAYDALREISFEGIQYRTDIAGRVRGARW